MKIRFSKLIRPVLANNAANKLCLCTQSKQVLTKHCVGYQGNASQQPPFSRPADRPSSTFPTVLPSQQQLVKRMKHRGKPGFSDHLPAWLHYPLKALGEVSVAVEDNQALSDHKAALGTTRGPSCEGHSVCSQCQHTSRQQASASAPSSDEP